MNKKGKRKKDDIPQSRWMVRSHKRWLTFHDVYATKKLAENARKAHQNVGSYTSIKKCWNNTLGKYEYSLYSSKSQYY